MSRYVYIIQEDPEPYEKPKVFGYANSFTKAQKIKEQAIKEDVFPEYKIIIVKQKLNIYGEFA